MSTLNFPTDPQVGDTYTIGTKTWVWTGFAWALQPNTSANLTTVTSETILVTSSATSTSTTTGALVVGGGVGIGGDVTIGGNLTVEGTINASITGVSTTATNLAGGTTGQIPYQTEPGQTSFFGPGTAGELITTDGVTPYWTSTNTVYVGYAVYSNNLLGGATGSIAYQTAGNATGFITIGSAGTLLQSDGTTATFTNPTTLSVGTATNISGGTSGELLYQTDSGTTGFVTPGNPGEVLVSDGTNSPTWQNTLTLAGSIPSTSTDSGTFVVVGGAGISGDLYVGGTAYVGGSEVLTTSTLDNLLLAGDDISITSLGSGTLEIDNTSTLQTVTSRGAVTSQAVLFTNSTESTGTDTGAVIISGGLGVGKRINCESIRIADTVFDSTESTVNTLATVVVDSFSVVDYRAAKYLIQVEEGTGDRKSVV